MADSTALGGGAGLCKAVYHVALSQIVPGLFATRFALKGTYFNE
jgi:hypothetical protein